MRILILSILLFFSLSVSAAPFLVSDPWPAAGPQPDSCKAMEGSTSIPLTLVGTTSKSIKHDVSGIVGKHDWDITCYNIWGNSVTVPFSFNAVVPSGAAGLRISPQ